MRTIKFCDTTAIMTSIIVDLDFIFASMVGAFFKSGALGQFFFATGTVKKFNENI
jgi:hypothetical protein